MRCEEFGALRTALVERCLDDELRLHAEAHAAVCNPCGRRLEREVRIKALVAAAAGEAPANLRRAVHAAIDPRARAAPPRRTATVGVAAALLTVATLCMVGVLSWAGGHQSALDVIHDDYERHRTEAAAAPVAPAVPDLTAAGLAGWSVGEVRVAGKTAAVTRYAGRAGTMAVYRLPAVALPRPPGAASAVLPGTPAGAWVVSEQEYVTLAWGGPAGTVVMVGTLAPDQLARLAPAFST